MTRLFRYGAGRKLKRELAGEGFDTVSVQFWYGTIHDKYYLSRL